MSKKAFTISLDKYWQMWEGKHCWNPFCEELAKKEFNCIHGFFCSKGCMVKFHDFARTVRRYDN